MMFYFYVLKYSLNLFTSRVFKLGATAISCNIVRLDVNETSFHYGVNFAFNKATCPLHSYVILQYRLVI